VIPAACFELVDGLIVYFSNAIGTEQGFRPTGRVEDGRGGFRLSVAIGVSFDTPPQSDLP
jgi:hypothetical protein